MSFGIYTAGKKEDVIRTVSNTATTYAGDTTQVDRVKKLLLAELNDAPDDRVYVVEASGHNDVSTRSFQVAVKCYWTTKESE